MLRTQKVSECVNMLLHNACICLNMAKAERRTEAELCMLSSTYRYIGVYRILPNISNGIRRSVLKK